MKKYQSLVGVQPKEILPYGPTKLFVDEYLWHNPEVGCVASYRVKEDDVKDHFGLFRGVDQLEFFAQSSLVSLGIFQIVNRTNLSIYQLQEQYNCLFLGVERVRFHHFVRCGETLISVAVLNKYVFKQMTCSGRVYKVPDDFDRKAYCSFLCADNVKDFQFKDDLKIIAEFENATGWYVKKEKLRNN